VKRRTLLQLAAGAAAAGAMPHAAFAAAAGGQPAAPLEELRLDYAYYSPTSLVLRRFGWLEQEFKGDGTNIKWVFSAGSNRALEYLNGNSIDIGSSAGLAALLARANGNPIRTPYIYSRPEWTALVVRKDSPIRSVADLRGKKIAATKGTDPYLFLLRSLQVAGLKRADIEHVCSTPTAAWRSNRARSTPGPGSIRTWRPASWKAARACCTGTSPSIPMAS
jgi:sulfonate transport system substrate-binding protein